jgi:TonB-dependent receptor
MSFMAAPAVAQEASSNSGGDIETVVVTGLIGSLQKNLDIKRDATGLVDAISAEDIGKFPDSNLAASMSRIPGVTVSRGSNVNMGSNVPTSTGDDTEITVRGFGPTFNETLYDGRVISTATGNRGFDFSGISSDFVSQIDVLKSPDASLSAGALGATINIKYPKPLDNPGFRVAGAVSTTYAPDDGSPTPNGNVLISDTFAHDTIGILADIAYTNTKTQANHVNVQGWVGTTSDKLGSLATPVATGTPVWFDQDYGIYRENNDEKRINGRLVLQWRPVSTLLITLNDDYSNDKLVQQQWGYSVWFNGGSLQNVTLDKTGTATSYIQPNTPTDFQGAINGNVQRNNDVGFNAKWDVSNHLQLEADADHAESWTNPGGELSSIDVDVGYGPSGAGGTNGTDIGFAGIGLKSLPYLTNYGPGGNASELLDPNIIGSHVIPITSTQNYDAVNQVKVDGTWSSENLQITAGFQYVSDRFHLRTYNDFANNDWQAYSGYGPASNNAFGVALNPAWFGSSFGTGGFIPGFANNGNLPPRILKFSPYTVLNYLQSLGNPQTMTIPGANTACCTPAFDGTYRTILSPGSYQNIGEDNYAGFITVTEETKIDDMPLRITGGVREEYTNNTSQGLGQVPTAFTVDPADHTAFDIAYGPTSVVSGKNSYQYLLPNLDLALQPTDDLQIRFDASRSLTRPPLGDLTPVYAIQAQRVGTVSAQGGNPAIQPFLSDNLDFSAEWYYQPNSYVSVDAFNKTVSNFIVSGTNQQTFAGVIDPTTGKDVQYSYTTFVNGPTANVYGLEFALQQVFGDSGFGVQANATVVQTDKGYHSTNLALGGFAVTGLADSANLVAFYEKYGFMFRVAANWRAGYLDQFGQHQNGSIYGAEPTFVDPNTQIDFSTSYDITDNINIYAEGLNLNDSTYATHGRFKEQLLDAVDYGRRFTLGVHFKF